ncbi:MAG: hypothetical protein HUN04_04070 [Desulfobacter sp.]|nr:MAG: hypothetical protein HUN04_04070 [Desulfobacter sp.]
MEDISRELEREIAKAKPAPYKTSREKKILIVDDFGELRSGAYLKTLVKLFFIVSVAGLLGSALLYYLFSQARKENVDLTERLAVAEKKAERLTGDKEILMARLVMAGKDVKLASQASPEPETAPAKEPPTLLATKGLPSKETQPGIMAKPDKVPPPTETPVPVPEKTPAVAAEPPAKEDVPAELPEVTPPDDVVSVEKFSLTRGKTSGQLTVRFNIRNISKTAKEISGRIFAVMKPEPGNAANWVVVPGGQMEKGIPRPYRKGQYFSITRFKPVKFTIRSQAAPDRFKTATVYVFGDDEKLMYKNTMAINGVD